MDWKKDLWSKLCPKCFLHCRIAKNSGLCSSPFWTMLLLQEKGKIVLNRGAHGWVCLSYNANIVTSTTLMHKTLTMCSLWCYYVLFAWYGYFSTLTGFTFTMRKSVYCCCTMPMDLTLIGKVFANFFSAQYKYW